MKKLIAAVSFAFVLSTLSVAQKTESGSEQNNEIGVTFGASFATPAQGVSTCEAIVICPPAVDVTLAPGFTFTTTFARRFLDFKAGSLYAEFPVIASPSRSGAGFIGVNDFSSLFFTPSLKLKFIPQARISPFVTAGAGLAHYAGDGTGATPWAVQVGGGVDFKTRWQHLDFRVEARDFISGKPSILPLSRITAGHLQQVYAGGGVVLKF